MTPPGVAPRVVLRIPGTPKPKGSLKCLGKVGRIRHQLTEDTRPGQAEWRARIADTVRTQVRTKAQPREPVTLAVTFTLPRPGDHYGTGRNRGILKPRWALAPATSLSTGDVDKLSRLLLDALTDGGLLTDDAQVIDLHARKAYTDGPDALPWPGAVIVVTFPTRTTTHQREASAS